MEYVYVKEGSLYTFSQQVVLINEWAVSRRICKNIENVGRSLFNTSIMNRLYNVSMALEIYWRYTAICWDTLRHLILVSVNWTVTWNTSGTNNVTRWLCLLQGHGRWQ